MCIHSALHECMVEMQTHRMYCVCYAQENAICMGRKGFARCSDFHNSNSCKLIKGMHKGIQQRVSVEYLFRI